MVARVRRLLRAGFERRDLTGALREEFERRREELAFLYGEGPSGLEQVLRTLCYAALAAAAGLGGAADRWAGLGGAPPVPAGVFSAAGGGAPPAARARVGA